MRGCLVYSSKCKIQSHHGRKPGYFLWCTLDMMNAHILSIGDELLIGDTVNTNADWIGRFLTKHGFRVEEIRTITDEAGAIRHGIRSAIDRADRVITYVRVYPTCHEHA